MIPYYFNNNLKGDQGERRWQLALTVTLKFEKKVADTIHIKTENKIRGDQSSSPQLFGARL